MKNLGSINDNKDITTKEYIDTELSSKSDSSHNHSLANLTEKSYNSLTDKPTSLPADGGDADTVDTIHGTQLLRNDIDDTTTGKLTADGGFKTGNFEMVFNTTSDSFSINYVG